MRNNLNVGPITEDVDKTGPTRHIWEANNHREKGMQPKKKTLLVKRVTLLKFYLTNYVPKKFWII